MRPPRPRAQKTHEGSGAPYPYASDFNPREVEVEDTVDLEAESFELRADYVPTMRDLSEQIGALGQGLVAVHQECSATRIELANLSRYVMGDHAPRITAVEQKSVSLRPIAVGTGKVIAYVTLGLTVATQVASLFQPKLIGPLEAILKTIQGLQ